MILGIETRFEGRTLPVSNEVVLRGCAISGQVKRLTGNPPTAVDTMLDASGIENNLNIATRNITDMKDSGAAIFNPWKDDPASFLLF